MSRPPSRGPRSIPEQPPPFEDAAVGRQDGPNPGRARFPTADFQVGMAEML